MSIILFPGQGSQFIGMGKKLLGIPVVNRMFEIAKDVFKKDILDICINGPQNELNRTINCQAAVYLTSLAAVEQLKIDNPDAVKNCTSTAGFSVGEYAALVFSGAITFEDGLRLIKLRSELMQMASEATPSGLMSVFIEHNSELSLAMKAAREWCEKKLKLPPPVFCSVANYLYPDCKVIGGNIEALKFIELNYKEFKLKRVKRLPVSGAFHTRLMDVDTSSFKKLLQNIEIQQPLIPTYSNVTAKPYEHVKQIPRLLEQQIYEPVKWEQIMHKVYERPAVSSIGFPETYECGPGRQLGTILKLVNNKAFQAYKNIEV